MDSSRLRPPLTLAAAAAAAAAGEQTPTPPLSPLQTDGLTQHPAVSLLRPPLREPSPPIPNRLSPNPAGERAIPSISQLSRDGSTKSPLQSPSRDPDNPIQTALFTPVPSPLRETPEHPILHRIPLVSQIAREGSTCSPARSPLRETSVALPAAASRDAPESLIPHRSPLVTKLARDGSTGSLARSPLHETAGALPAGASKDAPESPIPHRNSPLRETSVAVPVAPKSAPRSLIPHRSPLVTQLSGEGYMGSSMGSPLRETAAVSPNRLALVPVSFLVASPKDMPEKPMPPVGNRLLKDDTVVMTKSEEYSSGLLDGSEVASGMGWRRAVLGLRVLGLVLSLISFSVMVADKTVGWAGDSFDRYVEYRYLICRPLRQYFDFSMDQVLAYLLMSVSSSAASRNDGWVSMFGSDEFTIMANASIAMSFLAFITLALSSLVSAYYLFRRKI